MSDLRSQSGTTPEDRFRIKLLFDENLSYRLTSLLADVFPGAAHVSTCALQQEDDQHLWRFAASEGFTIVSKDSDFRQLSFTLGAPPRVIWINVPNCSTRVVENLLRRHVIAIIAFHRDPDAAFLALS